MNNIKVAVLGLDGLSYMYLRKLIRSSCIPFIKFMLWKGLFKNLHAIPPVTYPSWTSILTGANPFKHGITSFYNYNRNTKELKLNTALDLRLPRIHELLSLLDIRTIMINPIPSFPLIPLKKTFVISHLYFTPKLLYYPKEFSKYAKILLNVESEPEYQLDCARAISEAYLDLTEKIINEISDYNLFWLNLTIPDAFLHFYPDILFNTYRSELEAFKIIDKIARILAEMHDVIIIVSDHGFSRYSYIISINDILHKNSLVRLKGKYYNIIARNLIKRVVWRMLPLSLRSIMRSLSHKIGGKKSNLQLTGTIDIDVANSKAFMPSHESFGIYINDEAARDTVVQALSKYNSILRYKIMNNRVSSRSSFPDIVLTPEFDRGYTLGFGTVYGKPIIKANIVDHHPSGTFIMYSSHLQDVIKKINTLLKYRTKIENYNITPLILYLLNLPIPDYMDIDKSISRLINNYGKGTDIIAKWKLMLKLLRLK